MSTSHRIATFLVVYYSYIQSGELDLEPASELIYTQEELDLWMYDRYTDTLKNDSHFKARVYCLGTGKTKFIKSVTYP